jgi:hypothetical protein
MKWTGRDFQKVKVSAGRGGAKELAHQRALLKAEQKIESRIAREWEQRGKAFDASPVPRRPLKPLYEA